MDSSREVGNHVESPWQKLDPPGVVNSARVPKMSSSRSAAEMNDDMAKRQEWTRSPVELPSTSIILFLI